MKVAKAANRSQSTGQDRQVEKTLNMSLPYSVDVADSSSSRKMQI